MECDLIDLETPLGALRAGNFERACRLANQADDVTAFAWHLLIASELCDAGQADRARRLLARLEERVIAPQRESKLVVARGRISVRKQRTKQMEIVLHLARHVVHLDVEAVAALLDGLLPNSGIALAELARHLVSCHRMDEAMRVAARIDATRHPEFGPSVVSVFVEHGRYLEAIQVVERTIVTEAARERSYLVILQQAPAELGRPLLDRIQAPFLRCQALVRLADLDVDARPTWLSEIERIERQARKKISSVHRCIVVSWIGKLQAAMQDPQSLLTLRRAQALADALADAPKRAWALCNVAQGCHAAGDVEGTLTALNAAVKTVEERPDEMFVFAIRTLTTMLLELGEDALALRVVHHQPLWQQMVHLKIQEREAQSGTYLTDYNPFNVIDTCVTDMKDANNHAALIHLRHMRATASGSARVGTLEFVACALHDRGNVDEALSVLEELRDASRDAKAVPAFAKTLAHLGCSDELRELIAAYPTARNRDVQPQSGADLNHLALAHVLEERGDRPFAREVLAFALLQG